MTTLKGTRLSRWTQFIANKSILPAAALSAALVAAGLLPIWTAQAPVEAEMNRYGQALARSLALSSAGHLLHRDRIELAVIANEMVAMEEVAGIMFFDTNNEIIAISGSSNAGKHHTAPATLDDTMTGYASVVLRAEVFATAPPIWQWLLTGLVILGAPFISLILLQLSARGNRSLPIVSLPDTATVPQRSYCLAINLHNQMALERTAREQAVADAADMANEVCAIHQGLVVVIPLRGVMILLDASQIDAEQCLNAGMLTTRLLDQYETYGQFRCFISTTTSPGSPAVLPDLSREALAETTDIDAMLTLAALSKADTVLLHTAVFDDLPESVQHGCHPLAHPLLTDLTDDGVYACTRLTDAGEQWVDNQSNLILGFNQASA
ncbi:MAG: hypothetical protein AAF993_13945 [Pseudomonadota bacterium]